MIQTVPNGENKNRQTNNNQNVPLHINFLLINQIADEFLPACFWNITKIHTVSVYSESLALLLKLKCSPLFDEGCVKTVDIRLEEVVFKRI